VVEMEMVEMAAVEIVAARAVAAVRMLCRRRVPLAGTHCPTATPSNMQLLIQASKSELI